MRRILTLLILAIALNLCSLGLIACGECEHSFTNYVSDNNATCLEDGTKTATCDNGCGEKDIVTDTDSKLGHKFTNYVSDNNATCEQDGTKTATCDNGCGEKDIVTDTDTKLGHSFTNYVSDNNATCLEDGTKTATCDNGCGEKDIVTDTDTKLGHSFTNYVSDNNATCEQDGTKTATCDNGCGEKDIVTDTDTKLGHKFTNYVSDNNATCEQDGTKTATCDNGCGEKDIVTDTDTKLGHSFTNYVSDNNATCLEDGTKTATCDNGCGEKDIVTDTDTKLGHSFTNYVSDNNATCEQDGTKTATCDNGCGATDTIVDEGSMLIKPTFYNVQFEGLTEYQTIEEGKTAVLPTKDPTKAGYKFISWNFDFNTEITADLIISATFEKEYLDLPVILINTEDNKPVQTKETYIKFTASIENTKELLTIENVTGKIKGRGNSTWDMYEKKPYKIKFDEKVDLFGNGKAKEWTLIANHGDKSLIRNYLAYSMASVFSEEMPFTTTTQFVELYLNDEYLGVYLICEQNETGKNRVDIDDDYSDEADISYFIELDGRAKGEGSEGGLYFILDNLPYAIKTPDEDDDTNRTVHVNFIKEYFTQCDQALKSGDYDLVKSLIDVDSFASSYIINELFNCQDVGQSSFYMYKPKGDKLYSGPIWDYDISSGNVNYSDNSKTPDYLWAKERNPWYNQLLEYEEFKSLVAEKLEKNAVAIQKIKINCISIVKGQKESFERNFERWDVMGKYLWPNPPELVAIDTWEGQVDFLDKWLDDSLSYLLKQYCE